MKYLAAFSANKVKSAAAEKEKKGLFLCRRTVRIDMKSKVILTSFLEIKKRTTLVAAERAGGGAVGKFEM